MYKAGISVFNGLSDYNVESNLEYIKKAKEKGYEIIFSSAHINEANNAYSDLQRCIDFANELNMKLSLDISKPAFLKMESLKGLYALRLDYGFTDEDIVELSNRDDFLIELNASTISFEKFNRLIEMGMNLNHLRMSFNYYPKKHTGHDIEFVKEKIDFFHKYGICVGAFIPSHIGFRPPMYEGLPTVEKHRSDSLDVAIEELKLLGADEIIFGDAYASNEELSKLIFHQADTIFVNFKTSKNLDKTYYPYLSNEFFIRIDQNSEIIRLNGTRDKIMVNPFNTVERQIYDVTIDNLEFGRYQGEINIVLKPIEQDYRVNVVGKCELTDILLKEIQKLKKFKFIISEEYE